MTNGILHFVGIWRPGLASMLTVISAPMRCSTTWQSAGRVVECSISAENSNSQKLSHTFTALEDHPSPLPAKLSAGVPRLAAFSNFYGRLAT
jgi:hypothetical protein